MKMYSAVEDVTVASPLIQLVSTADTSAPAAFWVVKENWSAESEHTYKYHLHIIYSKVHSIIVYSIPLSYEVNYLLCQLYLSQTTDWLHNAMIQQPSPLSLPSPSLSLSLSLLYLTHTQYCNIFPSPSPFSSQVNTLYLPLPPLFSPSFSLSLHPSSS